jgi:ATP-independent RNA helicase DbpA
MTNPLFSELPLAASLIENLTQLGYLTMTPIQAASLPVMLEHKDLIAQAKTGSGKTAAFGIAALSKLNPRFFAIQALVMCPTRELADQVANELRRLARYTPNIKILSLCGGSPMRPQIASLEHGCHIVVGTPGRLLDHIERNTIDLSKVQTLVLDEADRMMDMGFYEDMQRIVSACSPRRQTLLFSATFAANIRQVSEEFLSNPVEVKVESQHESSQIEQIFFSVTPEERNQAVAKLLLHYQPTSSIAFCNTKIHCRELTEQLQALGIKALALHGDLDQRDRDEILVLFSNQSCSVLVATDVAARGLDIQNLNAVINVDISKDSEVHVHRIGRTGRAGASGLALSLASPNEKRWVKLIEEYQNQTMQWQSLPEIDINHAPAFDAPMITLAILGGKKDKLRPGDLLGALTGDVGLRKDQVGKINVFEFKTYVAIAADVAEQALNKLNRCNIKGRLFKVCAIL